MNKITCAISNFLLNLDSVFSIVLQGGIFIRENVIFQLVQSPRSGADRGRKKCRGCRFLDGVLCICDKCCKL